MAQQMRRFGPYVVGVAVLAGLLFLLLPPHRTVRAATFTSPLWTHHASVMECPCTCTCNRPPSFSPEGVSYISGALAESFFVDSIPGVREDYVLSLLYRSDIDGTSQLGYGVLAPWSWHLEGSATPSNPSSAAYVKKIDYNMDDDGNRSSVVVTPYGSSPVTTSYSYNSLNQYTAVGGVSQAHDGNGGYRARQVSSGFPPGPEPARHRRPDE